MIDETIGNRHVYTFQRHCNPVQAFCSCIQSYVHLVHKFSDSSSVRPMTVFAVRHVDDVDPGKIRIRLSLHDIRACTDQSSSCLHYLEKTIRID
jgi:hypothetical protein